ncbi:MAG: peptidylprolyl isomerase [Clostridia bacterium]|nr:peptidylprolyl isomerase [Clostridia bacterium]
MKKFICSLLCLLMICVGFTACGNNDTNTDKPSDITSGLHHVEMVIKDYGTVKLELNADEAPITVENFLSLAESGFYDGIGFHRLDKSFVLQGGDPDGDGYGGSDKPIKGEFAANGVQNDIKHKRGVISMARTPEYDSGTSQFFICLNDMTAGILDGQYAAFGYVTDGMDVIDDLCANTPESDCLPRSEQPIIETIKVID